MKIVCPLLPSWEDGLFTLLLRQGDQTLQLIADTGSAETVLFTKNSTLGRSSTSTFFDYQHMTVGLISEHNPVSGFLDCSGGAAIRVSDPLIGKIDKFNDITDVADGIIGLGPLKLGADRHVPFLFSPDLPNWSSVTISIPSSPKENGEMTFFTSPLDINLNLLPLASQYYWAVEVSYIPFLDFPAPTIAILDTGSNFIGLSKGIFDRLKDLIKNRFCTGNDPFVIHFKGGNKLAPLSLSREKYLLSDSCDDVAISEIDSSHFGDISDREIIILGTRALAGTTIGIHKSGELYESTFFLSLN